MFWSIFENPREQEEKRRREIADARYKQFLDAGYQEQICEQNLNPNVTVRLQKAIKNRTNSELFRIDILVNDYSEYPRYPKSRYPKYPKTGDRPFEVEFSSTVKFRNIVDLKPLSVSLSINRDISILRIEQFHLNIYQKLNRP